MDKSVVYKVDKIYDSIYQQCLKFQAIWKQDILFTWEWWLLVFVALMSWGLWIIFRKKESTHRLLYAGLFASLIASQLDIIGVSLGLWTYPINIILPVPPFIPWDLCLIPTIIMGFLQFKPNINPILKAVVFSGISSFVVEPLAAWGDFYHLIRWNYCYSFPIFAAIYLMANYLYTRNTFAK